MVKDTTVFSGYLIGIVMVNHPQHLVLTPSGLLLAQFQFFAHLCMGST